MKTGTSDGPSNDVYVLQAEPSLVEEERHVARVCRLGVGKQVECDVVELGGRRLAVGAVHLSVLRVAGVPVELLESVAEIVQGLVALGRRARRERSLGSQRCLG